MPRVVVPSRCRRHRRRRHRVRSHRHRVPLAVLLLVTAVAATTVDGCPVLQSSSGGRTVAGVDLISPNRPAPKSKAGVGIIRQRLIALERRFVRGRPQQLPEPVIVFFQLRPAAGGPHPEDDDILTMAVETFTRQRLLTMVFRAGERPEVPGSIGSGDGSAVLVMLLPDLAGNMALVEQAARTFPLATKLMLVAGSDHAPVDECPDEREVASARDYLRALWRRERIRSAITVWYRCPEACGMSLGLFDPFARHQPRDGADECRNLSTDASWGTFQVAANLHRTLLPTESTLNLNRAPLDIYGFEAAMAYRRQDIDRMPRTFPPWTIGRGDACAPPAPSAPNGSHRSYLGGLFGADIESLRELADRMNFTPRVHYTRANFGFRAANGSFTGVLGHLVTARDSWLSMNVYFLKDYETRDVQFTAAVYQDSLCVFVKAAGMLPDWLLIFRCFTPTLWIVVWSTVALVSLCYVALAQFVAALERLVRPPDGGNNRAAAAAGLVSEHNSEGPATSQRDTLGLLGQIVGALLNAPTNGINRTTSHQKLFVAFGLIWGMTLMGAFQGSLVDVYTTPTSMRNLDTLAELDASGLSITVNAPALIVDVFGTERPGTTIGNLKRRLHIELATGKMAVQAVLAGQTAGLIRNQDFVRISTKHLGRDGTTRLHRLHECPRSYPLAYLYPRGSPLYPAANWHILRFLQHGLYAKWERDATHTLAMNRALKVRDSAAPDDGPDGQVQLRLDHLLLPFILLAAGLSLASVGFACEHIRGGPLGRKLSRCLNDVRRRPVYSFLP